VVHVSEQFMEEELFPTGESEELSVVKRNAHVDIGRGLDTK
jgi:hypothetical protein